MFKRVDLFDQCPLAIDQVKAWSRGVEAVKSVKLATMQTFQFKRQYSLITFNWCIGYLQENQLVGFLRLCKMWLSKSKKPATRGTGNGAYIIVLDNLAEKRCPYTSDEGQLVRDQQTIEDFYMKAGLCIHKRTGRHTLSQGFRPTMAWALY